MAEKKSKGTRITRDLVIGALALRCPHRRGSGAFIHCGDEHPTNCNPRLCTWTGDFFKAMAMIANGEIDWEYENKYM